MSDAGRLGAERRAAGGSTLRNQGAVVPVALGGGAEPGNLRLRCAAHHRYRHGRRQRSAPQDAVRREAERQTDVGRGDASLPTAIFTGRPPWWRYTVRPQQRSNPFA